MRVSAFLLVSFLMFSTLAFAAPALSVSFVEGTAYQRSGSSWMELSIGDSVPAEASIRLDSGASVQLTGIGAEIYLTQKGAYSVRDLLAARQKMSSAGVGKVLSASLSYLLMGPIKKQNAVLGARGADDSKSADSDWVETSAQDSIQQAKDFIQSGQYDEAIQKLTQTLDEATVEEIPEVHYYLAYAYSQNGDTPNAQRQLAGAESGGRAPWSSDCVLLQGKLYLDTFAFAQAIQWLTQPGNSLSGDAQRALLYHFLLGMAYQGIGDTSKERASFSKVVAISAESDLGKTAAQLLQNP